MRIVAYGRGLFALRYRFLARVLLKRYGQRYSLGSVAFD